MKNNVYSFLEQALSEQPEVHYKKNEVILEADQPISHLYFIKSGQVKQYVITPSGDEVSVHVYTKPAIIPLMLVLAEKDKTSYYFQAITPVTIIKAPVDLVVPKLLENHDFLVDTTSRFASALYGMGLRVVSLAAQKQKDQLFALLTYFGTKYGQQTKQGIVIERKITHAELASWLGAARETVSRLLKQLEEDNLISYKSRKIVVHTKD